VKAIAKDPDVDTRRPVTIRPGDEINLSEYVGTAWRYRWLILAIVAVTALVTYLVNRQITPTYEVTVRMLATESQVMDDATRRALSVARFRELLESPSLIATVLQEFQLSAPPYRITPHGFLANNLSVREIPDTGILSASVRFTDPDKLVKIANKYAEGALNLAARLNQDETKYAREQLKAQADQSRERLTQAEKELEEFRRKAQIELLRRDVEAILERRPDVMSLQVDIESERAQLRQAEIELSKQERVRDVRRSLDTVPDAPNVPAPSATEPSRTPEKGPQWNPPSSKPQRGSVPGSAERPREGEASAPRRPATETASTAPTVSSAPLPLRSELNDPYVNPVYEVLARDVAQSRAKLAGLEKRRQQLVSELKMSAPSSAKLETLYRSETQLAHLTGEYEVARTAYMNAASKYEDARLQITVRSPRLQILDSALPPDRPVRPRIFRNVTAAAMLAFTLTVIAVLLLDSSRQRRG
jgi:succinoglycan biosynthesis transport protein ExoP